MLEVLSVDKDYNKSIIFVHGAYHAAWCWKDNFFPFFCNNGFNVYAFSLRGHGNSSGRDQLNSYTFKDYAEDLNQVILKCGRPPIIIAHSMGATVVYSLLKYYDCDLEKVIFLAPTPVKNMVKSTLLYSIKNCNKNNAEIFFDGQVSDKLAEEYSQLINMRESNKAKLQLLFGLCKPKRKRDIPFLTIGSWTDRVMLVEDIFRQAQYFNSKLIMLDETCHDMMLCNHWKDIAKYILEFIK